MNRRSLPLALVAAGCHAPTSKPPIEISHHVTASVTAAPALDLDDGARMWRALAPTGADYEARLAALPADDTLRRSMAVAMLRQGDFACNAYTEEYGCAESYFVLEPLAPDATLDDPCLRRVLALWSLDQLDPEDVASLGDVLVDLASMPSPEDALPQAAFALAADDSVRLRMLEVANEDLRELEVANLTTDEAKLRAFVDLHLFGALDGLDVVAHRDRLRPSLVDAEIPSWRRDELLGGFEDDGDLRTTAALVELTTDADCGLALRAATLLADRGDATHLPTRPRSMDPQDHLRAMCLLAAADAEDPAWASWFDAGGYASITVGGYGSYDEHDQYVAPEPVTERLDGSAYDDRLVSGAWTCDGLRCTSDSGWRSVTVALQPDGAGSLVVGAVTSEEYGGDEGCGC